MKKGLISAALAYILWGFFPIYFKALHAVPPLQVLAHRIVWSFLFLGVVLLLRDGIKSLRPALNWRTLAIYLAAGVLLSTNWGTYVWAVGAGHVVESSLGYFINPLVSVVLGVVFLREKLRPMQWVPVGMAAIGVAYLTISYGSLPWIGLVLALTFGFYGLMKKIAPLGSLPGLTLETAVVFLPALAFLLVEESTGVGAFGHSSTLLTVLLALAGVVTAIPLIFFATGARAVPLTTLGLLQYVAPTIQFLLGVLAYGEPLTPSHLVGFGIIWLALILFSTESLAQARRRASAVAQP